MKKRQNIKVNDRDRWIKKWEKDMSEGKYTPFIRTEDVASFGTKHRCMGLNSKRVHHLLSANEYLFFVNLEFRPEVIEICEQYPLLPVNMTKLIAKKLNVKHPRYIRTTTDMVLTTDFVVRLDTGERKAYSIKPAKALDNDRTIQKQAIEKAYWELKGIEWNIILDSQIKTTINSNLCILRSYANPPVVPKKLMDHWITMFKSIIYNNKYENAYQAIKITSERSGLDYKTSSSIFFYFIWHKTIGFNLDTPIQLEKTPTELGVFVRA